MHQITLKIKIEMLKIPKYLHYTQIPETMCKPSFLKKKDSKSFDKE